MTLEEQFEKEVIKRVEASPFITAADSVIYMLKQLKEQGDDKTLNSVELFANDDICLHYETMSKLIERREVKS